MSSAQAAQQNNRAGDGKYATKVADESGVDIDAGLVPAWRQRVATAAATLGTCPECKNPSMRGQLPGQPGAFVTDSICDLCGHTLIGPDPDEFTPGLDVARASRDFNRPFIDQVCTDQGYNMFATAIDVIRDRESVPHHVLLAKITTEHIHTFADTFDGYGYEKIADHYAKDSFDPDDEVDEDALARVEAVCDEAGLPSMFRVYERLAENGLLAPHAAETLDTDNVTEDYFNVIAPAIDRVEDRLTEAYVHEEAELAESAALRILEDLNDTEAAAAVEAIRLAGYQVKDDEPETTRVLARAIDQVADTNLTISENPHLEARIRHAAKRLFWVEYSIRTRS